jgi:hypothetical protein
MNIYFVELAFKIVLEPIIDFNLASAIQYDELRLVL